MRTFYPAIEVYAYRADGAVRRINGSAYRLLGHLGACGKPNAVTVLVWHRRISASEPAGIPWLILLIGATSSYVWLLLGMKFPALFGESYSRARFAIIDVNFVVTLGCSITALWSKGNRKVLLGIACLLTTLVWSIQGAINSVV